MFKLTFNKVNEFQAGEVQKAVEGFSNGWYTTVYYNEDCYLKITEKHPKQKYPNRATQIAYMYFVRGFLMGMENK